MGEKIKLSEESKQILKEIIPIIKKLKSACLYDIVTIYMKSKNIPLKPFNYGLYRKISYILRRADHANELPNITTRTIKANKNSLISIKRIFEVKKHGSI